MLIQNALDHGESDARPLRACREERIEEMGPRTFRDARSAVVHRKLDRVPSLLHVDCNLVSGRADLDGVAHEVPHDLPQLRCVGSHECGSGTLALDSDIPSAPRLAREDHHLTGDLGEIDRLDLRGPCAGEIEHVSDQIGEAGSLALNDLA